ncbi:hypothetical protein [Petroclostridium sp. X23]|uniref:hypothetical protein n=1 Tax=Petroclostridium sp. X23 TaxID=3045146 RepID=UPI0024AC83C0|nr:hypothetical protein [Petroclostridium sp. X23]WHH58714.1 hypothetical protein QKW49_23460 [Petroclostridium sp. X23]
MAPETRFIVADEMTTMLDAITQVQIWEVMMGVVKERNIGVLLVSHSEKLLERLCTKILDFEKINACVSTSCLTL